MNLDSDNQFRPLKARLAWILTGSLLAAGIVGVLYHEIWLDEAHHWLIARDSPTLTDLWVNMRYEGHPILWNLLLFFISRVTTNVLYMQLAHVVIAAVAIAIFFFYAPFGRLEKILFGLGYYILYEYTVISRNYSLLVLFLFLSIVLYEQKRFILLGLSLAVLANTHFFGLVFAGGLALMYGFELWIKRNDHLPSNLVPGCIILLCGICLSLWQIIPPEDSMLLPDAQTVPSMQRIGRTSAIFFKGLVPIPDVTNYSFWNSNILMAISKPLCAFLSFLIFLLPLFLFRHRASLLLFFYGVSICLIAFFYFSDLHAVRYYGMVYLTIVVCIWRFTSAPSTRSPVSSKYWGNMPVNIKPFVLVLLIIQALAGTMTYLLDILRPFSGSREAARIIISNRDTREVVSGGCGSAPVSAYLGRKIFYLNQKQPGSYCYLNKETENPITSATMLKDEAIKHVKKTGITSLLISHRVITLSPEEYRFIKPYRAPAQSALRNENYHIYLVTPDGS